MNFEDLFNPLLMKEFIWPNCIAGGSLRDSWYDLPVNDVDWFVWVYSDKFREMNTARHAHIKSGVSIMKGFQPRGGGVNFVKESGDYDTNEFLSYRSITRGWEGLNLILCDLGEPIGRTKLSGSIEETTECAVELIETFPVSISKIAYLPSFGEWVIHDDFMESYNTKVMKVDKGCPQKYFNKVWPKYGNVMKRVDWV